MPKKDLGKRLGFCVGLGEDDMIKKGKVVREEAIVMKFLSRILK